LDNAVALAETYLRLNGFFTLSEFQVQQAIPGRPGSYATATDLDILAVRLPWAAESVAGVPQQPEAGRREIQLLPDPRLDLHSQMTELIIGEVKEGVGELNRALQTPAVLHTALRHAGCCPHEHIEDAVSTLRRRGEYLLPPDLGLRCRVRLASFCGRINPEMGQTAALTVTLGSIVAFIRDRFQTYAPVLRSAAFRDPVLGLLKLLDKLEIELRVPEGAARRLTGGARH